MWMIKQKGRTKLKMGSLNGWDQDLSRYLQSLCSTEKAIFADNFNARMIFWERQQDIKGPAKRNESGDRMVQACSGHRLSEAFKVVISDIISFGAILRLRLRLTILPLVFRGVHQSNIVDSPSLQSWITLWITFAFLYAFPVVAPTQKPHRLPNCFRMIVTV